MVIQMLAVWIEKVKKNHFIRNLSDPPLRISIPSSSYDQYGKPIAVLLIVLYQFYSIVEISDQLHQLTHGVASILIWMLYFSYLIVQNYKYTP
jgi:hypothetical protein